MPGNRLVQLDIAKEMTGRDILPMATQYRNITANTQSAKDSLFIQPLKPLAADELAISKETIDSFCRYQLEHPLHNSDTLFCA
ncbi:hypothetical protein GCM10023116_21240 [Kistimonas scapharcae]|uniref:Uncharacterized protein n=1 Tax=Kistimonas scapharcae TaxID=1036133 RepID=A0ABP8V0V8_9GAMM